MWLSVAPRRSTSVPVPAGATRRLRSVAWIRSTSARIASTGRSARPVTHQIRKAASATISGSPIAIPTRRLDRACAALA